MGNDSPRPDASVEYAASARKVVTLNGPALQHHRHRAVLSPVGQVFGKAAITSSGLASVVMS